MQWSRQVDDLPYRLFQTDTRTMTYTYDQAGNRDEFQYGMSTAVTLAYEVDEGNRVTQVERKIGAGSYNDLMTYTYAGNFLQTRRLITDYSYCDVYVDFEVEYDEHRRQTSLTNTSGLVGTTKSNYLSGYTYEFDASGNRLTTISDPNANWGTLINRDVDYDYDTLNRLTGVAYSPSGDSEDFTYDELGNRVTYIQDTGTAVSTYYANNKANEYTGIDTSSPPSSNVTHDNAGNLTADHRDYEYEYHYDNRLTKVSYGPGGGVTAVADYSYDALGRRVRFLDHVTSGSTITTQYYYDGQNEVIEDNGAATPAVQRYYVHGQQRSPSRLVGIDERAVLHDGAPDSGDDYYYMLRELYSVDGLAGNTGRALERYIYDAYGPVTITLCKTYDIDCDGTVAPADAGLVMYYYGSACTQNRAPWLGDLNGDGDIDPADRGLVLYYYGPALASAPRSSLGNPYFFTGRVLDIFEDETEGIDLALQDNRNRMYYPLIGRWMQRDPIAYHDGLNLYEYCRTLPGLRVDPDGLWSLMQWYMGGYYCEYVRTELTSQWKKQWSGILGPVDYQHGGPLGQYMVSLHAYERAYWVRNYRNVYLCEVDCQCLYIYGRQGARYTVTSPDPPGKGWAEGIGIDLVDSFVDLLPFIGDFDVPYDKLSKKVAKDLFRLRTVVWTNWGAGTKDLAPEPDPDSWGEVLSPSGLPPGPYYRGKVNCQDKPNPFPGDVLDVGRG